MVKLLNVNLRKCGRRKLRVETSAKRLQTEQTFGLKGQLEIVSENPRLAQSSDPKLSPSSLPRDARHHCKRAQARICLAIFVGLYLTIACFCCWIICVATR